VLAAVLPIKPIQIKQVSNLQKLLLQFFIFVSNVTTYLTTLVCSFCHHVKVSETLYFVSDPQLLDKPHI
jgi:hypothetical protein